MKTAPPASILRRLGFVRDRENSTFQGKHFTGERVYEMEEQAPQKTPRSILMLEDDLELAKMIHIFLGSSSFRVTRVPNGTEGLRQILDRDFDIILCDLVMPHLPGDMFYLAVERSKPHLCRRFVFMTGHQADPKYDEFIRRVRAPMLWKPFLLSDLLTTIERTLEKNSPGFTEKSKAAPQETKWWM